MEEVEGAVATPLVMFPPQSMTELKLTEPSFLPMTLKTAILHQLLRSSKHRKKKPNSYGSVDKKNPFWR